MLLFEEHKIYRTHPPIIDREQGTIKIPLINLHRQIVRYAIADLTMAPMLLQYSFHAVKAKRLRTPEAYYACSSKNINMHELVMSEKAPPGYLIDHKNRTPLDNRRANLHFITSADNNHNRSKMSGTSSSFYGVHWSTREQKWVATINLNGSRYRLGHFDVEELAARVFDAHAILFYGKNARTNETLDPISEMLISTNGISDDWMVSYGRKVLPFLNKIKRNPDGRYPINFRHGELILNEEAETVAEYLALKEQFRFERSKMLEIQRNHEGLAVVRANHKGGIVECIVDDEVWRDISGHTFVYSEPYMSISIGGKPKGLHCFIYKHYIGDIPPGFTVDHHDSSRPLDDRLSNLRPATKPLQSHNQKKRVNSIGQYKGVNYMKGKFHTFVGHQSHGVYDTEEEAAHHANQLFITIYGDQARLNIIDWSKRTTKHDRIADENITLEFVLSLHYIKDLRDIATKKNLLKSKGGPVRTQDMKGPNFEWLKMRVAQLLFNLELKGLPADPPHRFEN